MRFYIPTQSFNNKITWDQFRKLPTWDEIIQHFNLRIKDYFLESIECLYKKDSKGNIKFTHNFSISNICWSLLDLFTQLKEGKGVNGAEVDKLLEDFDVFFPDVKKAKKILGTKTLYDIFRNKPFHNAMVKGKGGFDHHSPNVFTDKESTVIEKNTGNHHKEKIIIENPIELYEGIKSYLKYYIGILRTDKTYQDNFKKRIQDLFDIQFTSI